MAGTNSTAKSRLFIAIQIPEPVRNEILRVQQELRQLASPDAIRWTKPEQFHLTLKFLGGIPEDSVPALKESVQAVCAAGQPLRLDARGAGFFPDARSPRVIWIAVSDDEGKLAVLQKAIETVTRRFAEKPGAEKFAGHATLGRFKNPKQQDIEMIASHLNAMETRLFGTWTAREVKIVCSELSPSGARHFPLAAFCLGGC